MLRNNNVRNGLVVMLTSLLLVILTAYIAVVDAEYFTQHWFLIVMWGLWIICFLGGVVMLLDGMREYYKTERHD